jgi:hypothetical protein
VLLFPRAGALKPTACFPAILAVSKQANMEASGILYAENVIECEFTEDYLNGAPPKRSIRVHDQSFSPACEHNRFSTLPDSIDRFPGFLKRINQLEIKVKFIKMNDTFPSGTFEIINKCLLSLSSFLMDDHKLAHVTIDIEYNSDAGPKDGNDDDDDDDQDEDEYEMKLHFDAIDLGRIIYPLRRLRNIPHVEVKGDIAEDMADLLVDEMQSSTRKVHNTLKHWQVRANSPLTLLLQHQHPTNRSSLPFRFSLQKPTLGLISSLTSTAAPNAPARRAATQWRNACSTYKRA